MKKILLTILLLIPFITPAQGILKFEKDTIDVGLVIIHLDSAGKFPTSTYANADFRFRNTGNEPLIITFCGGGGRSLEKLPKAPVLPGKKDVLTVTIFHFKYLRPIDKDGLHAFSTELIVEGNFAGEKKKIYVTGYTKLLKK